VSSAAVELSGVTVRYGEVTAVRGVSLRAGRGEVHAIVGENGAGKSSLMRALFGLAGLSAGEVRVDGQAVPRPTPEAMIARGLGMVHQHFLLVDPLTVAENVVLGDEPRRGPWLDAAAAEREVGALSARHGMLVDPARTVAELSVGEQQRVEILKALRRGARILILDEPTAVLAPPEVADLLAFVRGLRGQGGTVLLVTHKLDEVCAIADRVTVLRRGEVVARFGAGEAAIEPQALVRAMVGGEPPAPVPRLAVAIGAARLELEQLGASDGRLAGVTLAVRGGETVGVAGVEGNGQAELAALVAGTARPAAGRVRIDGADVTHLRPGARRARGLGYVPGDRLREGLLPDASIADNLLLGHERRYAGRVLLDRRRLRADAARAMTRFAITPADADLGLPASALSGGNQQKLLLARELLVTPRVLLAVSPTRGVDVGAAALLLAAIDGVRQAGGAVLLSSTELDELMASCDRIAVLYRGRLAGVLERADFSAAALGALMTGAGGVAS